MRPAVRRRLRTMVRDERRIQIAIATESVAIAAVLVAGVVPASDRVPVGVVAALGGLATLLTLRRHQRTVVAQLGRPPAKLLSTISFYFIAVALWLTAFAAVAFATNARPG